MNTYIKCQRSEESMMLVCCQVVQDKDCPETCRYNKHRPAFWERKNLTSQSSRPDKAETQLQTFDGVTSEATNIGNQQSSG